MGRRTPLPVGGRGGARTTRRNPNEQGLPLSPGYTPCQNNWYLSGLFTGRVKISGSGRIGPASPIRLDPRDFEYLLTRKRKFREKNYGGRETSKKKLERRWEESSEKNNTGGGNFGEKLSGRQKNPRKFFRENKKLALAIVIVEIISIFPTQTRT